jgi:hypothetical protein
MLEIHLDFGVLPGIDIGGFEGLDPGDVLMVGGDLLELDQEVTIVLAHNAVMFHGDDTG